LQRRRAAAAVDLRSGHHALYHCEHHRPASAGGHPALRVSAQGRRLRSGEADPVHALPDHRPGGAQLDDTHRHRAFRALFGDVEGCQDLIANDTWWGISVLVLTLTAGTGLIMWLGEQITEHGVGNGMSLLIFT